MAEKETVEDIIATLDAEKAASVSQNFRVLEIDDISVNAENREADPEAVAELARSISNVGQIVPVIIDEKAVLLDGERRYRALKKLGEKKIRCLVQSKDQDAARIATNYLRENHPPEYLKKIFKKELKRKGTTQESVALQFGITQGRVSQIINDGEPEKKSPAKKKAAAKKKDTPPPKVNKAKKTVTISAAENIKLKITEKSVTVSFVLSNRDLRSPIKKITDLAKEINWKRDVEAAREEVK